MGPEHPSSPFGPDYPAQQQIIDALRDPSRYPQAAKRVQLLETHVSWVLLAGRHAYKIKKAVDFGFLDFSALDARRFYCAEELRLNRRLAPGLYLDVVTIGGTPQSPVMGALPAIEYAVKMRRFPGKRLLDRMVDCNELAAAHVDRLALTVARFHVALPPAAADSAYGTPAAVRAAMRQNFEQLAPLLDAAARIRLDGLREDSEREFSAVQGLLAQRRAQGLVRECHGDLHLGNIVLLHGTPVPFDCIEFNPDFRWIDVISELAFLVMDLRHRGRPDFASRLLNVYLEETGDYAGVGVLRFFVAYRALVRAKVAAFALGRAGLTLSEPGSAGMRDYLRLSACALAQPRPALLITHGLPGSGKSLVARMICERLDAVRLRSDVERKRLFGLAALQRSDPGRDIYGAEATRRTYDRLAQLARGVIAAGHAVVVDAAFLRQEERERFRALARAHGIPFAILDVAAPAHVLRERVRQREADASEADVAVLEKLEATCEPLDSAERASAFRFDNNGAPEALDPLCEAVRRRFTSEQGQLAEDQFPP